MADQSPAPPDPLTDGAVLLGGEDGLEVTAKKLGILCRSCGQAMSSGGHLFVILAPEMTKEGPIVRVKRAYICDRKDCDQARDECFEKSTAWQIAPAWTVLDVEEAKTDGE